MNQQRADVRAVLYTPTFGESTRTSGGRELVLERAGEGPWFPLRVGTAYEARIREVRNAGNTPLSSQTMILSIGPQLSGRLPVVKTGEIVGLSIATKPDLRGVDLAIGGGPPLLRNGKAMQEAWPKNPRHPRTVLGWNDTHYFLIVVDGRRAGYSIGMNYPELAALAKRLGCTNALNLDGGGSSTLWVGGRVVNRPSDGRERRVASALVVYRKKR